LFDLINDLMRPLPAMAQSLISTLFISIVPIFFIYGLNILFLASPWIKHSLIYYLISFAIGGLLGDVFFHTIPHMNSSHSHSPDDHAQEAHEGSHSHSHSHDPKQMCNNSIIIVGIIVFFLIEKITKSILGVEHSHSHSHDHKTDENKKDNKKGVSSKEEKKAEEEQAEKERQARYTSHAVLSLIGDLTHNFTDGLSIGVAYVASKSFHNKHF
jgi:zinc transporter 7